MEFDRGLFHTPVGFVIIMCIEIYCRKAFALFLGLTLIGYLVAGTASAQSSAADSVKAENVRWYKGNLHTHSLWSDGNDFPEMICQWYKSHGYHPLDYPVQR